LYRAAIQWIQGAATALAASRAGFLVGAAAFFVDAISVEAASSYERGQSETDYLGDHRRVAREPARHHSARARRSAR
jgi:hypothetical protein